MLTARYTRTCVAATHVLLLDAILVQVEPLDDGT